MIMVIEWICRRCERPYNRPMPGICPHCNRHR